MNVNDVYIYILIASVFGGLFESFVYILIHDEKWIHEGIKACTYSNSQIGVLKLYLKVSNWIAVTDEDRLPVTLLTLLDCWYVE
jgi:hypothetical protein